MPTVTAVPVPMRIPGPVVLVISVERWDSKYRAVERRPGVYRRRRGDDCRFGVYHHRHGIGRSPTNFNTVVASFVIVVGFDTHLEVANVIVNPEGHGAPAAGDVELVESAFVIVAKLDPEFAFQVGCNAAERQQVFTVLVRCEHHPVFIIPGVDRARLRSVVEDPDGDLGGIVRLEHIRSPSILRPISGQAHLLGAKAVAAEVVIVRGFDFELEVTYISIDIEKDFAVAAVGDVELLGTLFFIAAGLDPEFAFQISGNICNQQEISTRGPRNEHDPVLVVAGVYGVLLGLVREDLHRHVAFGVRLELVKHIGVNHLRNLRLRLKLRFGQERLLNGRLYLGPLSRIGELGVQIQFGVVTRSDQAYLPPSGGRDRQGDSFVIVDRLATKFPGALLASLGAKIQIAISVSAGSCYYKLPCVKRDVYPPHPHTIERSAQTADRLPVLYLSDACVGH
jgi:hypothetical protein